VTSPRKIVIDHELCSGHGRCAELMPEVFQLDADGFSTVRGDAPEVDRAALERVMALCPELAISVRDD
jgi:ferredoxin